MGTEVAFQAVQAFLTSEFSSGPKEQHPIRVQKIANLVNKKSENENNMNRRRMINPHLIYKDKFGLQ